MQGWIRVIRSEISRHGCLRNFAAREGINWESDIVAAMRWINPGPSLNDIVGKMLASIKTPTQQDALAKYTGRTV